MSRFLHHLLALGQKYAQWRKSVVLQYVTVSRTALLTVTQMSSKCTVIHQKKNILITMTINKTMVQIKSNRRIREAVDMPKPNCVLSHIQRDIKEHL